MKLGPVHMETSCFWLKIHTYTSSLISRTLLYIPIIIYIIVSQFCLLMNSNCHTSLVKFIKMMDFSFNSPLRNTFIKLINYSKLNQSVHSISNNNVCLKVRAMLEKWGWKEVYEVTEYNIQLCTNLRPRCFFLLSYATAHNVFTLSSMFFWNLQKFSIFASL